MSNLANCDGDAIGPPIPTDYKNVGWCQEGEPTGKKTAKANHEHPLRI